MPWTEGEALTPTNLNATVPSFETSNFGNFHAKAFGAVGNGATDDLSSIQSAINAAGVFGGGTVRLAPGTYAISSGLSMITGVALVGESFSPRYGSGSTVNTFLRQSVLIVCHSTFPFASSSSGSRAMVYLNGAMNCRLSGIEFSGNNTSNISDGSTFGVMIGTAGGAVTGVLRGNHTIEDCTFSNHQRGVWSQDANFNRFLFVNVGNCWEHGFSLGQNSGDFQMVGCYANNSLASYTGSNIEIGTGVFLGQSTGQCDIIGGKFEFNSKGIVGVNAFQVNIVGANFDENTNRHFVWQNNAVDTSTTVNITGCEFLGGGYLGGNRCHLFLEADDVARRLNATIAGNTFKRAQAGSFAYSSGTSAGPIDAAIILPSGNSGALQLNLTGNDFDSAASVNKIIVQSSNGTTTIFAVNNSGLGYDVTAATKIYSDAYAYSAQSGTATAPAYSFASETSLGLFLSATSTLALSYGTFNLNGAILSSIRSTNASATSATLNDGEFRVAAVSVTSAELAYRSGNTTYRFIAAATAV